MCRSRISRTTRLSFARFSSADFKRHAFATAVTLLLTITMILTTFARTIVFRDWKQTHCRRKISRMYKWFPVSCTPIAADKPIQPILLLTIRYDMRCYFNVRSKADIGRLNLPHVASNKYWKRKCADAFSTVLVPWADQWPFPMLKHKYIFSHKYTEAILSNSTRKLLWFEITKMPMTVFFKYCVIYYHFRQTFVPYYIPTTYIDNN